MATPERPGLDWEPTSRYPVRLCGDRVELREWETRDRSAVADYARDPEVSRYLIRSAAELAAEPEMVLAEAHGHGASRTTYRLAVGLRNGGTAIGSALLDVESPRHHRAELGYILRREHWGQGLGTEIGRLLMAFGFEELGLHRLWATCHPDNRASARVLEKIGMIFEGKLRECYLGHDGRWHDALLYAAVRDGAA